MTAVPRRDGKVQGGHEKVVDAAGVRELGEASCLLLYQAANVARRRDPQLAVFYHRLMLERGHCHIQANCAVARKLTTRVWAVLTRGEPYEYRDLDDNPIEPATAAAIAASYTVPDHIRRRVRACAAAYKRGRLSH